MDIPFTADTGQPLAEYASLPPDLASGANSISMQVKSLGVSYLISGRNWFGLPASGQDQRAVYERRLELVYSPYTTQLPKAFKDIARREILQRFIELLELPSNWDSYGARKISSRSVEQSLNWLASVYQPELPTPSIVPGSDGTVQLEWHMDGAELEILFHPTGNAEYLWEEDGEMVEGILNETTELNRYLQQITDRTVAA